MPKVSIVIPIYNTEKYLRQCLDSITGQTLKDIEIICVDDGSKDSSLSIIREYEKRDPRIKVITKPNAGYGHSMNMGLDAATGEYFGIVDGDDYILSEMYETLYALAEKNDLDIVRGAYYKFYEINGEEKRSYWGSMAAKYRDCVYCPRKTPDFYMSAVLTPSGIYKLDFIRKNKIRYSETPGAAFQDQGFWFKTHLLAEKVMFIDKAFYLYRFDNPNSSIYKKNSLDIMGKEYDSIAEFVKQHPELAYAGVPFYWKARFLNCKIIYSRLVNDIKPSTVRSFSQTFQEARKNGTLDVSLMAKPVQDSLNELIDKPRAFCRKLKISVTHDLFEEHIQRDLSGQSRGRLYQFKWFCKRFGIGFASYMSLRKIAILFGAAAKSAGKKFYFRKEKIKEKMNPDYLRRKRLDNQLLSYVNTQKEQDYRNDQMFWWSINLPGESLSDTKKRFFLNMPKAEGSLRIRQNEYTAVLCELKKLLDEHHISFWFMGGSMVGALRHKGFVPWDDDIDISMMYRDKDKLFDLVNRSETLQIEEVYWCGNTVLRCPRVKFRDQSRTGLVDIFLWETATNEPTGFNPLWQKRNMCSNQMNAEYRRIKPNLHHNYNGESIADPHDAQLLEGVFEKYRKECIRMCGTGGTTIYGSIDMWFQAGKWLAVYAKEDVFPMRTVEFEGEFYQTPKSSEQFLTDQYGDWMALPTKVRPSHGG